MTNSFSTVELIMAARKAYENDENITQNLRLMMGLEENSAFIIEVSYDLQAGTYVKSVLHNAEYYEKYHAEYSSILRSVFEKHSVNTCLDVGAGELTTLVGVMNNLADCNIDFYALDISVNRIKHGLKYCSEYLKQGVKNPSCFAADIYEIPLPSNSIDFVISSHALEPNGGRERNVMSEVLRVAKYGAVLFEPSFEDNSDEGQERMSRLGYVKGLPEAIDAVGGKLVDKIRVENISNPLNPTYAFVIEKVQQQKQAADRGVYFTDPGSEHPLELKDNWYRSTETGLVYPVLDGVPILRTQNLAFG